MGGYITTDKAQCKLGETFHVKGSVKQGVLTTFDYNLYIGSAIGESLISSGLKSKNFSGEGVSVTLDGNFAAHASPYGSGNTCYIKAIGIKDPNFGSNETVEYVTYINLKGDLLPEYEIKFKIDNSIKENSSYEDFEGYAVKGFTKVTATVETATPKFGEKITYVQFSGGIFNKNEVGEDMRTSSCEVNPIKTAGECYAFTSVTNNLGYQTSKSAFINVLDYREPSLVFNTNPCRKDDNGAVIDKVNDGNKNAWHNLEFDGQVVPCEMKAGGIQICKIHGITGAKVKRIDDSKIADISNVIIKSKGNDGSFEFSYSGKPKFGDDDEGLQVYKAYELIIECVDSSLRTHELKYRINTLGTAFHLRKGGNGAWFGAFSQMDNVLGSEWDIHGKQNIEADGILIGSELKLGEESINGFGSGERQAARGNHIHGFINDKGQLLIYNKEGQLEVAKKKLILITDENGYIVGIETLTSDDILIANDSAMKASGAIGESGSVGTAEAGFCFADHIHPYSDAWKNDAEFIKLQNSASDLVNLMNDIKNI